MLTKLARALKGPSGQRKPRSGQQVTEAEGADAAHLHEHRASCSSLPAAVCSGSDRNRLSETNTRDHGSEPDHFLTSVRTGNGAIDIIATGPEHNRSRRYAAAGAARPELEAIATSEPSCSATSGADVRSYLHGGKPGMAAPLLPHASANSLECPFQVCHSAPDVTVTLRQHLTHATSVSSRPQAGGQASKETSTSPQRELLSAVSYLASKTEDCCSGTEVSDVTGSGLLTGVSWAHLQSFMDTQGQAYGLLSSSVSKLKVDSSNMLLHVSPFIPKEMRRRTWMLGDYQLVRKVYKGYTSSVYKVSPHLTLVPFQTSILSPARFLCKGHMCWVVSESQISCL